MNFERNHTPRSLARGTSVIAAGMITALLFCLLSTGVSQAKVASFEDMDRVCRNWLTYIVAHTGDWAGVQTPEIAGHSDLMADGRLVGRYYDISPAGFVLVPVLRDLPPIKAYSEQTTLDLDDEGGMTQMLRQVLDHRVTLFIDLYGSLDAEAPPDQAVFGTVNRARWEDLAVSPKEYADVGVKAASSLSGIEPLTTTTWHQSAPYNNLCPIGFEGNRCVVGCVATAMAQIMYYHRWPRYGTGEKSYWWQGDISCEGITPGATLYADFSDEYVYDTAPENLAELNYEVGVAFSMYYGYCGSSSYTSQAVDRLPTYFNYSYFAANASRGNYSAQAWFDLIKADLNMRLPILYSIVSHAIVCDGWREAGGLNQYHFNYGWGGSQNAWYVMDNLYCPWSGCNYIYESMVAGIIPQAPVIWVTTSRFSESAGDGDGIFEPGETVEMEVTVANYGAETGGNITLNLITDDTALTVLNANSVVSAVSSFDSMTTAAAPFRFSLPADHLPRIDSFYVECIWNNGSERRDTVGFECTMGAAAVLLVDDDNGDTMEDFYTDCFYSKRTPHDILVSDGDPDTTVLNDYEAVVWFTGDYRMYPLNVEEVAAMKQYLDGGGNLFLTGQGIAAELHMTDSTFLHDYLKATWQATDYVPVLGAVPETQLFHDTVTVVIQGFGGAENQTDPDHVAIVGEGRAELQYLGRDFYGGLSYAGDYRLVFFSFGFESIRCGEPRWIDRDEVMERVLRFFTFICGDANGDGRCNVSDAVFLINHIFRGGPLPYPYESGNVNCDAGVNVSDAVYLINYIFRAGAPPCDGCE